MLNIKQYAAQYAKWHAKYEKKLLATFYSAIAESIKPVLSSLDVNDVRRDVWREAYIKAYKITGVWFARQEYLQLKRNNTKFDVISFLNDLFAQRMAAYGAQVAFYFETDLTETTQEQIRRALSDAAAQGLTNQATARLIASYTVGVIGRNRAALIARTEVTTASNLAKIEGAKEYFKEIGETGGYKMWISRADSKVRPDHVSVNETAVPFNEPFDVGGFEGQQPGDPKLPAKERVRCRCTFVTLSAAGYRRRFGNGS